jgi:nitronate monooxygenase
MLDRIRIPVAQAPMAGGPSTPALAAAVGQAGGLGFVAAGYKTAAALREDLQATRALTAAPLAVNVFSPSGAPADPAVVAAYVARLEPEARRAGVALGEPRFDDDDHDAKIALLVAEPVAAVSFTFGCPAPDVVRALQGAGTQVWVTVTDPAEARIAADAGADALVVQGVEAGGHRGAFADRHDRADLGLLALLQLAREATGGALPLIAAGGLMTRASVRAVLAAGASGAACGTAFALCPEAGTSPAHRAAIADPDAVTGLTRAFSGRLARGIVNRVQREHTDAAPIAYPEIHHVTAPLRAHARQAGDGDLINLWAGEAHALAQARPAAEVVAALDPGLGA